MCILCLVSFILHIWISCCNEYITAGQAFDYYYTRLLLLRVEIDCTVRPCFSGQKQTLRNRINSVMGIATLMICNRTISNQNCCETPRGMSLCVWFQPPIICQRLPFRSCMECALSTLLHVVP